jgi:hypothetical protein
VYAALRVPCEYAKDRNLSICVEEKSRPPSNLSIRFLYQGGQTDIVAIATVSYFLPSTLAVYYRIETFLRCLYPPPPDEFGSEA